MKELIIIFAVIIVGGWAIRFLASVFQAFFDGFVDVTKALVYRFKHRKEWKHEE
jgi:hypothetical protein